MNQNRTNFWQKNLSKPSVNKIMGIPSIVKEIKIEDVDEIAQTAIKEANPLYPVPKIMGLAEMKEIIMKLMQS